MMNNVATTGLLPVWLLVIAGCTATTPVTSNGAVERAERPDIVATNAFYYYADVETAWAFYRDTLGLETVVDYGFAKIMRVADSTYLTLVRASEGMHSTDEPKTVTLSLVTDELSTWHRYLVARHVPLVSGLDSGNGQSRNHFVVADPEGYLLRFVRYNPHPNHDSYVAAIANAVPVVAQVGDELARLSIRAVSFSAYFANLDAVRPFYEGLFDMVPAGLLNGIEAYQLSGSGFLQLVEGGDDLHQATEKSGMTLSFLTSDVDTWFDRATGWPGFVLRTPEILDEGDGLVRVFVGYDPAGIFLEWDTFMDVPENDALLRHLP